MMVKQKKDKRPGFEYDPPYRFSKRYLYGKYSHKFEERKPVYTPFRGRYTLENVLNHLTWMSKKTKRLFLDMVGK